MDDLDVKIISILNKDSRTSITELSKVVNLSRPSVSERIEKMMHAGIIDKFTLKVDLTKTKYKIVCFLDMSDIKIGYDSLESILTELSNVIDVYRVTGQSNYLVKAVFTSVEEMNDILEDLIKYAHIETKIILNTIVEDNLVL